MINFAAIRTWASYTCCLCTQHTHASLTRVQKVLQIIHEVADVHINAASRAIQRSIAEKMDEVSFVLEKASLPRPPVLGIIHANCWHWQLLLFKHVPRGRGHAPSLSFPTQLSKVHLEFLGRCREILNDPWPVLSSPFHKSMLFDHWRRSYMEISLIRDL